MHLQIRTSPVHLHYTTNRRTRPHTLLPFMHGHHTQPRDTRAHTCSCTCANLRAHAHTPCTHPLAHAHALVHMHTPRAHAYTRSTHCLVHAHTLARTRSLGGAQGGAGQERPPGPGRRRQERARRRGPRRARACLPYPGPGDACREPRHQTALGWAARRERAGVTPASVSGARRGARHGPQDRRRRGG